MRSFNTHKCNTCNSIFTRRADYKHNENCLPCANKIGGEKRQTHKHNNRNSRLHVIWNNMKQRCLNKNNKKFSEYGGKGISVSDDWLDFEGFLKWSKSNGYGDHLTLDRVDNNLGYSPLNCRFVDISTQNANKRITEKNTTGFIGVSMLKGKYRSYLGWKGKRVELGRFNCKIKAAQAREDYIVKNGLPHTRNFPVKELEQSA